MDIKTVKQTIIPILKKYHVRRASLFGSVVSSEMKRGSDIDVLVELPKNIDGLNYIGVRMDLQEELEKKLRRKIDLVEYELIKPRLRKYILSNQSPIYP